MIKDKYLKKLEYDKIIEVLSTFSKTYIGKELCLNLKPYFQKSVICNSLLETSEAVNIINKYGNIPIVPISDISIWIKFLNSNNSLSSKALLEIAQFLRLSRELKDFFYSKEDLNLEHFYNLDKYFSCLYTNLNIEKDIFNKIIDENTIDDKASSQLYNIRSKKKFIEQEIKNKLNSIIHSSSYSKYIQESLITIRNDRFVIPIKEEYRSFIKGFIHDISSSGSTVFIEPLPIFELNNEINNLYFKEKIEIEKILTDLSNNLHLITNELINNIEFIGKLDFIFAKANYSIHLNAIEPILNDDKNINLIQARHPLINSSLVVPIDINIGKDFSCLVITGPNTGGKTVSLKTAGIITLMCMSGLHIPAKENSSIYIFDNVFADIGDEQSIQESLSTFSSHMLNIVEILKDCTDNSLILVDELGSGTDPIEGSSLAISILEYLYKKGSLIIATTHFPEIKNYALITNGFKNASCEFDIENLKPTYRLLIGIPGKSNAFEISKKLGLNYEILERAQNFIHTDNIHIEDILKNIYDTKLVIEKEKVEVNKNLNQITNLRKDLENQKSYFENNEKHILEKAKIEARELILKTKSKINDTIRELNNSSNIKDLNNLRNTLNDSLNSLSTKNEILNTNNLLDIKNIKPGLVVFVNTLMKNGTILSYPNNSKQVLIQIENIKTYINISEISVSKKTEQTKSPTNNFSNKSINNLKSKNISTEINVIGQNIDEAVFVIDKYLDNCILSNLSPIRIVHGKGTGKLRKGIHDFLRNHPHVKSFRIGTYGEGELGVTIVELK